MKRVQYYKKKKIKKKKHSSKQATVSSSNPEKTESTTMADSENSASASTEVAPLGRYFTETVAQILDERRPEKRNALSRKAKKLVDNKKRLDNRTKCWTNYV